MYFSILRKLLKIIEETTEISEVVLSPLRSNLKQKQESISKHYIDIQLLYSL